MRGLWIGALAVVACSSSVTTTVEKAPPEEEEPAVVGPSIDACELAIEQVQACMQREAFAFENLYLLEYQQSEYGPCGSCHRDTDGCSWLSFDEDTLFTRWSSSTCVGERMFSCELDASGEVIDVIYSNLLSTSPTANHAVPALPPELTSAFETIIAETLARWRAGDCWPTR